MRLLVALLVWLLRATFVSRGALALENLALRQQLATYARSQKRPRLNPEDRAFWVALSRVWQGWRSPLAFVNPATVMDWHRCGFRRYWRWRSHKPGRRRIPDEHIAQIQRISPDHTVGGRRRRCTPYGTRIPSCRSRHLNSRFDSPSVRQNHNACAKILSCRSDRPQASVFATE